MTRDYTVMTFWAGGYRAIDPESYSLSKLISSLLLCKITLGLHWGEFSLHLFPFLTLEPKSGVLFDVLTCDMISTNLLFIVYIRVTDRKPACCVCAVLFGRLTHPTNLMHRVSFLPLTAPLAPADTNWMRKQNARLYVAEVAGVLSPGSLTVPELERLSWSGGSVTAPSAQTTYSRNLAK